MPPNEPVWIAHIVVPPGMVEKLSSKHGVSEQDVRDTFELPGVPQRGAWNVHEEHGVRLYVKGVGPAGQLLVAILAPTNDPDVWRLRTAWRIAR